MPTKKSKGKGKKPATVTDVPPLPTEAPPLPDEVPPVADAAPPLPDEAPPLPDEQPPLPTEQPPLPETETVEGEPVTELGEGDDEDEDEGEGNDNDKEGEPADDKSKGKSPASDPGAWQAVWSPEQNAYYFWNKDSGEVTWTNPLAPAASGPPLPNEPAPAASGSGSGSRAGPLRPAAIPDIDPALHHLLAPEQRGEGAAAINGLKYAPQDYNYSFTHLDEYNRAKRFSEHYFDVDGWEKQKAAEAHKRKADEEAGVGSSKKLTKRDMDRFRAKKAEQKQRRQAWLYD